MKTRIKDTLNDVPEKFIDWEQRRFEIAKDIYVRYVDYPRVSSAVSDAQECIKLADVLIKELKKAQTEKRVNYG